MDSSSLKILEHQAKDVATQIKDLKFELSEFHNLLNILATSDLEKRAQLLDKTFSITQPEAMNSVLLQLQSSQSSSTESITSSLVIEQ